MCPSYPASPQLGMIKQDSNWAKSQQKMLDQGSLKTVILVCVPKDVRKKLQKFTDHLAMQAFMALLVLIDGLLMVAAFASPEQQILTRNVKILSVVILWILTMDVFLRFLYMDIYFFKDIWCVMDFIIIVGCQIIEYFLPTSHDSPLRILVFLREARFLRIIVNFCRVNRRAVRSSKSAVSGKRRRYKKDGFDLDITFITQKLIAMSVPAVGKESVYRNPSGEVARFFKTKYQHWFHIYNLVPERHYDYSKFENQVYEYFMEDHNPAPIPFIIKFLHDIHTWYEKDVNHIAAVHCKGGKGRTGTMVCSYLLFSRAEVQLDPANPNLRTVVKTADEALEYFALRRTDGDGDKEGVEARSQTRYVGYMASLLRQYSKSDRPFSTLKTPKGRKIQILKVRIVGCKNIMKLFGVPTYIISTNPVGSISTGILPSLYTGDQKDCKPNPERYIDYCDYIPTEPVYVQDDVKVSFYIEKRKDILFGFWFHTYFEKSQRNNAGELIYRFDYAATDGIRHAIKHKEYKNAFPDYFECQVYYADMLD